MKRETSILQQIYLGWSLFKINIMEEFDCHFYAFTNKCFLVFLLKKEN